MSIHSGSDWPSRELHGGIYGKSSEGANSGCATSRVRDYCVDTHASLQYPCVFPGLRQPADYWRTLGGTANLGDTLEPYLYLAWRTGHRWIRLFFREQ